MPRVAETNQSLLLAAIPAPFAAPTIFCLLAVIGAFPSRGWAALPECSPFFPFMYLIITPVAFVVTWCLGLPLVFLLRSFHTLSTWAVWTISLVLGALTMLALLAISKGLPPTLIRLAADAGLGAGLGLSVAIVFCAFARLPFRSDSSINSTSGTA